MDERSSQYTPNCADRIQDNCLVADHRFSVNNIGHTGMLADFIFVKLVTYKFCLAEVVTQEIIIDKLVAQEIVIDKLVTYKVVFDKAVTPKFVFY